jgi:hypothetical protein
MTPISANPTPIAVVETDDTGVIPSGTWAVDVQRSNVTFTVKHNRVKLNMEISAIQQTNASSTAPATH